jgi:hypothetical protein
MFLLIRSILKILHNNTFQFSTVLRVKKIVFQHAPVRVTKFSSVKQSKNVVITDLEIEPTN